MRIQVADFRRVGNKFVSHDLYALLVIMGVIE